MSASELRNFSRRGFLGGSASVVALVWGADVSSAQTRSPPLLVRPGMIERAITPHFSAIADVDFNHGRPLQGRRPRPRFHEARAVNLSELHFRHVQPPRGRLARDFGPAVSHLRAAAADARLAVRAPAAWNSAVGRRQFANRLVLQNTVHATRQSNLASGATWQTLSGDLPVCTTPHVTVPNTPTPNDGNYFEHFPDGGASADTYYITVGGVVTPYNDEPAAEIFARQVRVSMPFSLPFRDPLVVPTGGWFYNYAKSNLHGAIDFQKTSYDGSDPSFMLYATADGVVVAKAWDDRVGNYIIIEHTASNGDRYRSHYCHVRDGFDHDRQHAMACTYSPADAVLSGTPPDDAYGRPYLYYLFVRLAITPDLTKLWGTNAQTIQVNVGDTVYAGQHIGWSGNTGWGGAGWGLDSHSTPLALPYDPNTGNNHLHFYFSYAPPGAANFTLIDSYGVYSDQNYGSGCYDVGASTLGPRIWAPYLQAFHNVPIDVFLAGFSYYPGMGCGLQTLSVYDTSDGLKCAGAFDAALPPNWYARVNMTSAELGQWYGTYDAQNMRPRQVSVLVSGGVPYFTVIWQPKASGEASAMWVDMTDDVWNQRWQSLVVQGHIRVEDHFVYTVNGVNLHAAIYAGSGGFYEYHYLDAPGFQSTFDQLYGQNFRLTSINVLSQNGQNSYCGVWRPMPGSWCAYDLSTDGYQTQFVDLVAQGYWLHKVQGYAGGGRFAAIWKAS